MEFFVFILEIVILAVLFTVLFLLREPIDRVCDLPKPIYERCLDLGLIEPSQSANSLETILKKMCAGLAVALILALMLYFFNQRENLIEGALLSYLVLVILNWYDCFVLDWIFICRNENCRIPGTEDLTEAYTDRRFHLIQSLKGMVFCIPVALISGSMLQVISWIMK